MKRNEMAQPPPSATTMGGAYGTMSEQSSSKRHRSSASPSKCLHVRALPMYCTEHELTQLFGAFGRVDKILIMTNKQQAFVQMDSVMTATNVVNHFAVFPAVIRNKNIHVQYSNHQELSSSSSNQSNSGIPANSILMVSIENVQAPITLDNLVTVFKTYGSILRIVTFLSGFQYKALIQMGSIESAAAAKANLEGKDMFQGCCTLRINFSKLQQLKVTNCGPKSWDFTQRAVMDQQHQPAFGMVQQLQTSVYGNYSLNPYEQKDMLGHLGGYDPMNNPYGLGGGLGGNQMGMGVMSRTGGQVGAAPNGNMRGVNSPVLLVSNLPEDGTIKPINLFNLFSCYGNVLRVKILYKKLSTALIQFSSPLGANLARRHLNGVELGGRMLDVRSSNYLTVRLPKDEDEDSKHLNADYTTSPLHRFKMGQLYNQKNIFAPSTVLHISNIDPEVKVSSITSLFGGLGIRGFEWLVNTASDKKMAFVQLMSLSNALQAVMHLHSTPLKGTPIRISFSKQDRTVTPLQQQQQQQQQQQTGGEGTEEKVPDQAAVAPTTATTTTTTTNSVGSSNSQPSSHSTIPPADPTAAAAAASPAPAAAAATTPKEQSDASVQPAEQSASAGQL